MAKKKLSTMSQMDSDLNPLIAVSKLEAPVARSAVKQQMLQPPTGNGSKIRPAIGARE